MAVENLDDFNAALDAAAEKLTGEHFPMFHRRIALKSLRGIVERTPVGNPECWKVNEGRDKEKLIKPPGYVGGTARGNWQLTVDKVPSHTRKTPDTSDKGEDTIARESAKLAGVTAPGHVVFLTNNLPYAEPLENGHSGQAPDGMVALTLEEVKVGLT